MATKIMRGLVVLSVAFMLAGSAVGFPTPAFAAGWTMDPNGAP